MTDDPMPPEMERECIELMKLHATNEPVSLTPEQWTLLCEVVGYFMGPMSPAKIEQLQRVEKILAATLPAEQMMDLHVRFISTFEVLDSDDI